MGTVKSMDIQRIKSPGDRCSGDAEYPHIDLVFSYEFFT